MKTKQKKHDTSRHIQSYISDIRRKLQFEAVRCAKQAERFDPDSLDWEINTDRAATLITIARCFDLQLDESKLRSPAEDNSRDLHDAKRRMRQEAIKLA